jgi:HPt (histidine-containing phosphotransfer) domain-containing protein
LAIDAVLKRCMGDTVTVLAILNEFEQQAAANLLEIKRDLERRDCEGLARVAHALKGASGVLSADAITEIAFKLERMGRTGVFADEDRLLTQLNDEIQRYLNYLPTARAAISNTAKV